MTFLLFAPASTKWRFAFRVSPFPFPFKRLPRRLPRDHFGRFCDFIVQSYFDTLLRYVLSVTFCGAVVSVKVMDQKFNDTR